MSAASLEPPWSNQPYSIKRHGCTITQCDSEPIQTPGCIQAHGALLVLRTTDLHVLQVSENSAGVLGLTPQELLGRPATALIGESAAQQLLHLLSDEPIEHNPLFAFSLAATELRSALQVTAHTVDGVAVLEFEPEPPIGSVAPDYYALIKKTVSRLELSRTLAEFCRAVTSEFRTLTGLDRVMIYRFHPDQHGEVFAESKREDLPSWLGLHYPAEDIPKPARDIFQKIWIRPLQDAQAAPVELVPLVNPDTGAPLNMTYCALRGASVMYTEYLTNMGVAASLTMPIRRENQLWGLIAGHHYVARPFPYQVRAASEFLAQVTSLLIGSKEEREHLAYRLQMQSVHGQLIAAVPEDGTLETIVQGSPNLLDGIEAGGAALFYKDRWWTVGRTPTEPQLAELAAWLADRPALRSVERPVFATDTLAAEYPAGAAFANVASGLLAVSLSHASNPLLIWFRPETIQTINWAGNPHDKPSVPGPNGPRLTPRASFALFEESVRHRSLPWHDVELDAALNLRLQIMQLVVSQSERLATLNEELLNSNEELDTFAYVASHDLKEPLRGISKYAHQLLESGIASETEHREKLERVLRLSERMDSLLESLLRFSRVGRTQLALSPTDLNEVVEEALEMLSARQDQARTEIEIPRTLPTLLCDHVRVREIYANLVANALKYNDKPVRRVELGYLAPAERQSPVPNGLGDQTILYVRDNGIGIEARHHAEVFKMFKRLHGRDEFGGGTGAGLAIVQMLVRRHHGCLWLESEPAEGSTFYFTLGTSDRAPPARA